LDKIDWKQFIFRADLPGQMLFGNIHMAEAYWQRWREVREITDDFLKVEQVGQWLTTYRRDGRKVDQLTTCLQYLCIRYFRKEVLGSIKKEILEEQVEAAISGQIMLCRHELERILTGEDGEAHRIWTVRGNGMKFKELRKFVDFLWGYGDGVERKHWSDKGYRTLYQRCAVMISGAVNDERAERWKREVKEAFVLTNWMIPYPNKTNFWQQTKQGKRMWLSVYHARVQEECEGKVQMVEETCGEDSVEDWTEGGGLIGSTRGPVGVCGLVGVWEEIG
jgi:hypothetical protein